MHLKSILVAVAVFLAASLAVFAEPADAAAPSPDIQSICWAKLQKAMLPANPWVYAGFMANCRADLAPPVAKTRKYRKSKNRNASRD